MRTLALGSLLSALLLLSATAAPVPKESRSAPLELLYGKPDVGADTCEFRLDGTKLIISVPASVESPATRLAGAPRTKKEVTGDFEMEVSVSYKLPVTKNGHAGAGLAIWQDDGRFALANRHHWPAGNAWSGGFDVHYEHPEGKRVSHGATCEGTGPETPARLRLRRQGDVVTTWESRDAGKTWNKLTESELKLPATVNVGVVAFNSLKAKMEVHCDALTIAPLGKR